jgi:hypothetical protein
MGGAEKLLAPLAGRGRVGTQVGCFRFAHLMRNSGRPEFRADRVRGRIRFRSILHRPLNPAPLRSACLAPPREALSPQAGRGE